MKTIIKNEEGVCPLCGDEGNLDYGTAELCDGGLYYPWECPACGASGREWSSVTFAEHYNVYDKDGNEILED